jgi:hypothetical protein
VEHLKAGIGSLGLRMLPIFDRSDFVLKMGSSYA